MSNEFIIGLGGCGGKAIAHFRKTCMLRKADFKTMSQTGTKFEYLYIDSDDDVLREAATWSVYGRSTKLENSEKVMLKKGCGPLSSIQEMATYPNIKPWIGDIVDWFKKHATGESAEVTDDEVSGRLQCMAGAGQLRRYGRVLFAYHSEQIRVKLERKIQDLIEGRDDSVNFRIFCTLGGGTGSGSIVDIVTLIKTMCSEMGYRSRIILHVFLGGMAAKASNIGTFYENEYCALRDLNALAVNRYKPYIAGLNKSDWRNNYFDTARSGNAIDRIYLSTEMAPGNPSYPRQIEAMAAACFDTIVYEHSFTRASCLRALTGQDLIDEHSEEPDSRGRAARSYRFAAMGTRRWSVPTETIKYLLRYDTEKRMWQAWLTGSALPRGVKKRPVGHDDLPGFSFDYPTTSLAALVQSYMDEYIIPMREKYENALKEARRDVTLMEEIREIAQSSTGAFDRIREDMARNGELEDKYNEVCNNFYDRLIECLNHAICWGRVRDVWGLRDVYAFLINLRVRVQQWPLIWEPGNTDNAQKQCSAILDNMSKRIMERKKLTSLSLWFTSKAKQMLKAHLKDAENFVRTAMWSFRHHVVEELADRVNRKINNLIASVNRYIGNIENRIERAEAAINGLQATLSKHANVKNYEDLYEYDNENLQKVREGMLAETKLFESEMANYAVLWEQHIQTLDSYQENRIDTYSLEAQELVDDTLQKIHDAAVEAGAHVSVLGGDIIERLKQIGGEAEESWNESLGDKIRNFMSSILMSTKIYPSDEQEAPTIPPSKTVMIGLPESSDPLFTNWLKQKLIEAARTQCTKMPMSVRPETYTHSTRSEITVCSVTRRFPACYVPAVRSIAKRYTETVLDPRRKSVEYFTNIDDHDIGPHSETRPPLL